MRLILEAAKISTTFINNATYHPMNPDADVTYQTVNFFSSDKCFSYFISDVPHYIRWNQRNTVCTILVKVDVLNTCGAMICWYFGIMDIQNNQSLEFEWIPMLGPLRSVNDRRFSWVGNVFLKSFQDWINSVQHRQENFSKDNGQKMFISWQTYEGLKISVN